MTYAYSVAQHDALNTALFLPHLAALEEQRAASMQASPYPLPAPLLLAFLYSIIRVAWELQLQHKFETTEIEPSNFELSKIGQGCFTLLVYVFGGGAGIPWVATGASKPACQILQQNKLQFFI